MTTKEEKFFRQIKWYHGTTLAEWKSICSKGILAHYNIGISLDFGCGFYLSPSEQDTLKYALNTIKYNGSDLEDDNIPVVIEFIYSPWEDLTKQNYKYFAEYDDEFAEFVFLCRRDCKDERCHTYSITGGVMTDTFPTKVMQQYFVNQITKEDVLREFKRNTSKKQLCLHKQELCDKLKPNRAYIVGGKELDVNEYTRK